MGSKNRGKVKAQGGFRQADSVSTSLDQTPKEAAPPQSKVETIFPVAASGKKLLAEVSGIIVAGILAFWLLTSRIEGIYVSVLNDEYTYLVDTLPEGESKTGLPNYLFRFVYAYTLNCGNDFYSCARNLNAVLVIFSALFVYLLARHLSGKVWVAAISGSAAILGSLGTYTAYFMPEAIFNIFMLGFFWALIRFGASKNLAVWAAIGSIAGIASLAKPHAFFVIPAVVIFVFFWTRATSEKYLLLALARIGSLMAAMVLLKFAVGYLMVGEAGVTIFGAYGGAVSSVEAVSDTFGQSTWVNVPTSALGQILMTTMILGLSLAVSLPSLLSVFSKDQSTFVANKFRVLFALALLNMMAVAALFEAWVGIIHWMHTRYHSYLIPLGIVVFAEAYRRWDVQTNKKVKYGVFGLFAVLSVIALVTAAEPYGANWIDAPDFRAHIDQPVLSSISILLALALATWWLWDTKGAMRAALVFSLISSLMVGNFITNFLKESFGTETPYDQLGRALRVHLPQAELDKAVLVGDNWVNLDRALFMAVNGGATKIQATEGEFDLKTLDPKFEWIVKVGEVSIEGLGEPIFSGPNYSLHSLTGTTNSTAYSNQVSSVSNLCTDSEYAGWVCGSTTKITLDQNFPKNAKIDLIVEFDEAATGSELELVIGDAIVKGTPPAGSFVFTLNFANTYETNEITISEPSGVIPGSNRFLRVISLNVVE